MVTGAPMPMNTATRPMRIRLRMLMSLFFSGPVLGVIFVYVGFSSVETDLIAQTLAATGDLWLEAWLWCVGIAAAAFVLLVIERWTAPPDMVRHAG